VNSIAMNEFCPVTKGKSSEPEAIPAPLAALRNVPLWIHFWRRIAGW
jgi:hypothetical protein